MIHKAHCLTLSQMASNKDVISFVGFVTSHRKGNVLVSFHIHSFAVFYTEEGPCQTPTSSIPNYTW